MILTFLRVSVSILFFINKILMLKNKKSGWLLGSMGGVLAVLYFLILRLYIYSFMEFSVFLLMLFSFVFFEKQDRKAELVINIFITFALGFLALLVFSGILTVVEFISSVAFIFGTYLFYQKKIKIGWFLYIFAHAGSTYLGYIKEEYFFMVFQTASIIVAIIGMLKPRKI